MIQLITGGSGSGKSAFAEDQVLMLSQGERIYLATMHPYDKESFRRIDRHRKMRSEKGFTTVERYTDLAGVTIPEGCTLLLECMSNLVANEMFEPQGAKEETVTAVLSGIQALAEKAEHLVIVTNEIFSDAVAYETQTRQYQKFLGEINCRLGEIADQVYEVVYGIPICLKGEGIQ